MKRCYASRVMDQVRPRADGCWEWLGRHDDDGYAICRLPGAKSPQRVHRVTYAAKHGPIPPGRIMDHYFCDRPWCVNPDHVRPVTHRENTLRSKRVPLVSPAMRCPNGHDLTIELGTRPDGYPKCKACMRNYQKAYRDRVRAAADA